MAEQFPTTSECAALSGTTQAPGVRVPVTAGGQTFHAQINELWWRLAKGLAAGTACEVYKDDSDPLDFGVRAGTYMNGTAEVNYAGAAAQALVDDATNYIYLTAAGALTVNQTGFPDEGTTPHIPLATIKTGSASVATTSGLYDFVDMTDMRSRAMLHVLYGASAAELQDMLLYLAFTGVDDTDDTGSMTIQVKDIGGNNRSGVFLLNVWIANDDMSEPDAQTGFTVDVGALKETIEPNADLVVMTNGSGLCKLDIDAGGPKTVHVMATTLGQEVLSEQLNITT